MKQNHTTRHNIMLILELIMKLKHYKYLNYNYYYEIFCY